MMTNPKHTPKQGSPIPEINSGALDENTIILERIAMATEDTAVANAALAEQQRIANLIALAGHNRDLGNASIARTVKTGLYQTNIIHLNEHIIQTLTTPITLPSDQIMAEGD